MPNRPSISTYPARAWRALGIDLWRGLLLIAMGLYTWIFAGLAIAQHQGMRTHKADLGQIDQAIWNSSRGRFVEMTDFGFLATRMTDHVEPILAFISPIYWLWDDTRAILILQTLFVAGGAWILYHLTLGHLLATLAPSERDKIWHTDSLLGLARPVALSLAGAYLLAPPLQAAVLTEFHAVPLVVPLVLWAVWAVEARRWPQFAVAVFLVATVKEETALLAAGLGVWAIWRVALFSDFTPAETRPPRRGPLVLASALTLLALAWFYIATFVIVPAHAEPVYGIAESGYFARYGALGDSPADILRSFFTRPALVWEIATEPVRLDYLRRMLMPFGYLSLLAPDVILLSLPVLLANQLSAYPAQYYGEYHYSAPVFVYFAAAAALGVARLWRAAAPGMAQSSASFQHMPAASALRMNLVAAVQNARTALRPLLALGLGTWLLSWGILSYVEAGRGPGGPRLDAPPVTAHHRLLPHFVAQIPRDASVSATAAVHPHVSHRRFVYQFPTGLDAPTPPTQQATWALLDVTMAVDMAPGDLRARVEAMLAGEWGVVDAANGFLLLHKGAPQKQIPPAFYSFTGPVPSDTVADAARDTAASEPANGNTLTLLATELIDRPYWRATQIVSEWRVGPAFDPALHTPRLAIHMPGGEEIDSDINATAPALTWRPPHTWQPGDHIRITTLPHYLPRTWGIVAPAHAQANTVSPLVAAYTRTGHDTLRPLPGTGATTPDQIEAATEALTAVARRVGLEERTTARFHSPVHGPIHLTAWTPRHLEPGRAVDVLLAWETADGQWPADLNVFVHLRTTENGAENGTETNQAQADGSPRYFIARANTQIAPIWDWRQLRVDRETWENAENTHWRVVVGLYDPASGVRVPLVAGNGTDEDAVIGDEIAVGELEWAAPAWPDQTCALIPATCASQ